MTRLDDAAAGVGSNTAKHESVVFDLDALAVVPAYVEACIETYSDACRDMKAALVKLDKVRVGFPIDEDASNHIQASQDISRLYRALTYFTELGDDK